MCGVFLGGVCVKLKKTAGGCKAEITGFATEGISHINGSDLLVWPEAALFSHCRIFHACKNSLVNL